MANIFLEMSEELLTSKGALFTAREIAGQPELWLKTFDCVDNRRDQLSRFLNKCFERESLEIILTGAGTSAFIGENLAPDLDLDLAISLGNNEIQLPEEYLAIVSVLPAQLLGFFKSLNLELKPDSPSASGTITRVVEGVEIYPYRKDAVSGVQIEI